MGSNRKRVEDNIPLLAASLCSIESRIVALQQQPAPMSDQITPVQRAKEYYHKRRSRERTFGSTDLFADPAWDILIDLFIASEERKAVTVSCACIASLVPTTTALRYIILLEDEGHILRSDNRSDARLAFLCLSESAKAQLRQYFSD